MFAKALLCQHRVGMQEPSDSADVLVFICASAVLQACDWDAGVK